MPDSYSSVAQGREEETMAHYSAKILEEELKNKVREDWFGGFDGTSIHGKIDFSIAMKATALALGEPESLYWAEAKAGTSHDIYDSITQLVLTIGKARAPEKFLPPKYLGAFDAEKIAFLEYWRVADVFTQTDFNWNVTPSDHSTREFHHVHDLIAGTLDQGLRVFDYDADAKELARFIRDNFRQGDAATHRIAVTRNNVLHIYQKWREKVRPTIGVPWDGAKKAGILDADFFLADLLSKDGSSILDRLQVLLKSDHYVRKAGKDSLGFDLFTEWGFSDGQKAHAQFWNVYRRPPKREFWGAIIERRDQLVPQDIRETKGAFFTPRIWVEKSQEAIAEALGENWQDEYDVWDCCAGTGNLLNGLTEKGRLWASTLDDSDVAVMRQRIHNGANLFENHVFQFDFLNAPLDSPKIPQGLRDILADPERRKKLVVYINPPYAEAATARTKTGTGANKTGVATEISLNEHYKPLVGAAANELFALFLLRVSQEIPGCILAQFSTLKHVLAPNFKAFREVFRSKLKSAFLVPASTFDNVSGKFP
ncbi:MAG: hypothetical protein IKO55_01255, partial [Kiritimatiellae bacterium]|nr:hypothetical protein [Kiritimatiellia bacterium]